MIIATGVIILVTLAIQTYTIITMCRTRRIYREIEARRNQRAAHLVNMLHAVGQKTGKDRPDA